jgi:hypothetical protein
MKLLGPIFLGSIGILTTGCGIANYPGQPGLVTNGYSKIDLEVLMDDGLWVYETTYDNRSDGKGVSAIVTKLYPGARTYTTNVRTNEFGTFYRTKSPYQGASVQMISMPQSNQYVVAPDSHVMIIVDYDAPLDEVDDRNLAEEKIFTESLLSESKPLSKHALELKSFRHELLKLGRLNLMGNVSYEISAIEFAGKIFTPEKMIRVESNILQNGLRTNIDNKTRYDFVRFLDYNFPEGFRGEILLHVNGEKKSFKPPMTIKTPKMLQNSEASWTTRENPSQYLLRKN